MHNANAHSPTPYSPHLSPSPPFTPALAVVGYAQVSTDLQREEETSKTQVELIERYCVEEGYRLVKMSNYDGMSGTLPLEQRPGGRRLLELWHLLWLVAQSNL